MDIKRAIDVIDFKIAIKEIAYSGIGFNSSVYRDRIVEKIIEEIDKRKETYPISIRKARQIIQDIDDYRVMYSSSFEMVYEYVEESIKKFESIDNGVEYVQDIKFDEEFFRGVKNREMSEFYN